MKKQISREKKLADWELAFYSKSNSRKDEFLKSLIEGLRDELKLTSIGVAC